MLNDPTFLGFSMVRRRNRRLLVAVTYTIALAMSVFPLVPHLGGRGARIAWWVLLTYCVASWAIFGRLAKHMVLPQLGRGEMTSLGLTPRLPPAEGDLDEREVAVRNATYFTAYRAVAVCSFLVWTACFCGLELGASAALLLWFVTLLAVMIWTLPPAVILWTEPDVPEEARA